MKRYQFFWSIENISYAWHQTGRAIVSPQFCCKPFNYTLWTLELYPRGVDNSDFFSVKLCRGAGGDPDFLCLNIKFSVMSADGTTLHSVFVPEYFTKFRNNGFSTHAEECFLPRYEVLVRKRDVYLSRDTLELHCQMWMDDGMGDDFEECFGRTRINLQRINLRDVNIVFEDSYEQPFPIRSPRKNKRTLFVVAFMLQGEVMNVGIIPVISEELMRYSTCKMSIVNERTGKKILDCTRRFVGFPKKTEWILPFVDRMTQEEKEISGKNKYEILIELAYSTGDDYESWETIRPIRIPEFFTRYVVRYTTTGKLEDFLKVSDDLWEMYKEQVLCDVELKIEKKSIFAHQFVLCARSSVFTTMLNCETKEKTDKCIEIEDIRSESLEEFLKFLYTNSCRLTKWKTIMELYYAADKYEVERLKLLCSSHLLKNINVQNYFKLLFLADRHQDHVLRRRVERFIWENDETIFSSFRWRELTCEQPNVIIRTMLSKYCDKERHNAPVTYDILISICPEIHDEFKSFYERQISCDIVIKTAGTEFPAHKAVLGASSLTFKELFTKDESVDIFEMEDFDNNTVSRMLLFLYTDCLEDMQWHTAMRLYDLANVYKIHRLKIQTSCFLLRNLKVPLAFNLLLFAHERHDNALKSSVKDYIMLYHEEIFRSDDWATFIETNSTVALELMQENYRKK